MNTLTRHSFRSYSIPLSLQSMWSRLILKLGKRRRKRQSAESVHIKQMASETVLNYVDLVLKFQSKKIDLEGKEACLSKHFCLAASASMPLGVSGKYISYTLAKELTKLYNLNAGMVVHATTLGLKGYKHCRMDVKENCLS